MILAGLLVVGWPQMTRAGEVWLARAAEVTEASLAGWKQEGADAVAVLIEKPGEVSVGDKVRSAGLELYFWIETGRDAAMAKEHPEWMASLGSHQDWLKRFPTAAEPGDDEVAKAFPWVPIRYGEAFRAHLKRVGQLLDKAPAHAGVFLNHLQGGPASCGCGNTQCRWATDYHVAATGQADDPMTAASRFVKAVGRMTGSVVIPVWTTECEDQDLPPERRKGAASTGLCGSVPCAQGACPKEYSAQWKDLAEGHTGPVALLALHREFARKGPGWAGAAVTFAQVTMTPETKRPLWAVVQGETAAERAEAAQAARAAGAGRLIIAGAKLDQSYEPRIVRVKK